MFNPLRKHQESQTDMTYCPLNSDPLSELFAKIVICNKRKLGFELFSKCSELDHPKPIDRTK